MEETSKDIWKWKIINLIETWQKKSTWSAYISVEYYGVLEARTVEIPCSSEVSPSLNKFRVV